MAIVIPYVKQPWTDGSGGGTPVSAARLGVLEEGVLDVSQAPAVHVTHNTTQSITNNTFTALAFNTERYDQAGGAASTMHDTVTNNSRLTAIYAGVYKISGNAEWSLSPTNAELRIRLNGATYIAATNIASDYRNMNVSIDWAMAVNDYVELVVWQNAGVSRTINNTSSYSPEFMMVRVA